MSDHRFAVVIVAGGRGTRAKLARPKQYAPVGGMPLLRRTILAFANHPDVGQIQVVIGDTDLDLYHDATAGITGLLPPVTGGKNRQASVKAGLQALLADPPSHVLIHDGARPFVSEATISAVMAALSSAEGAIAALPVADTLKRANAASGIEETVPRDRLWRAQTPQGFRFETILEAHRKSPDGSATDDASMLEALGIHVALVPDDPENFKLTYGEDFVLAEKLLAGAMETRTGLGIDVHAFEPGDAVTLCGLHIPHTHKLKGHSDADVALHAIADAIYGAIGDGDIGEHFPPSDDKWRGAPSSVFVEHARDRLIARGGSLTHVDLTLVCEAPKIGPHRETMREAVAEMLKVQQSRIAIKATTSEGLGFTGRREGILAQAVATVQLPA